MKTICMLWLFLLSFFSGYSMDFSVRYHTNSIDFLVNSFGNGIVKPNGLFTKSSNYKLKENAPGKEKMCRISGTVVRAVTKSILLVKPGQDWRFDSLIEIPVVDGKFYYETHLKHPEAVNLFFGEIKEKGSGRFMNLFLENEPIELTIYPEEEFEKNIVQGGKLNAEFSKYKAAADLKFKPLSQPLDDHIKTLHEKNEYSSDAMKEILKDLNDSKSKDVDIVLYKKMDDLKKAGLDKTPLAKELTDKRNEISLEQKRYKQKYIEQNPNLISYSFFLNELIYFKEKIDMETAKRNYEILSKANPGHPYNDQAYNLVTAVDNIKVGKKYTDFSAPDLNGKMVQLSGKIEGKIALLDLWATWCGPCIARTKTMVPLYDEFKNKGFTIVGVAGEFKNTNNLLKFLEREKWPWLHLLELDRQNMIWQKYGVDNAGGAMFLIDKDGKILAKDPTAEEVRKELMARLE